jgi:hypothetical protein
MLGRTTFFPSGLLGLLRGDSSKLSEDNFGFEDLRIPLGPRFWDKGDSSGDPDRTSFASFLEGDLGGDLELERESVGDRAGDLELERDMLKEPEPVMPLDGKIEAGRRKRASGLVGSFVGAVVICEKFRENRVGNHIIGG